jgi:integrase
MIFKQKRLPIAIDEEEFIKLVKASKNEKQKLAFLLGFGAGMRVSEIVKLESKDVDIKERKIFIHLGKGGKDRVVPLPKGFKEKHLELLPIGKQTGTHRGIQRRGLAKAFKEAAKDSGLLESKPEAHFHSLRHGFASQAVKNGIPIHYVRTLMGHSNISTTNVYLELNPTEALKSYEELF